MAAFQFAVELVGSAHLREPVGSWVAVDARGTSVFVRLRLAFS